MPAAGACDVTAIEVRADTDAHTVHITVDPAALAAVLVHIAAEIGNSDGELFDLFDELDTATDLAEHAHPDTLAMLGTTRDAAFERRDEALTAVLKELPAIVWPLSYPDADRLADDLRAARRAGAA
jgi:hypothetical protein